MNGESVSQTVTDQTTLADLGIGISTVGQGEVLDFNEKLRQRFGVNFSKEEIDAVNNPKQLTLREIAKALQKKL